MGFAMHAELNVRPDFAAGFHARGVGVLRRLPILLLVSPLLTGLIE